jgi:formate hydrogenlyase subunit 4
MNSLLLNIGHDIVAILIDLIAYVNKIRAQHVLLKIVLWPVMYSLTFAKVMLNYLANGSQKFYNHSFPEGVVSVRQHLYSATPASIYCFNKRGLLLFFLEIYFFCFFCIFVWERPARMYPYLLMKFAATALPFLALSPVQRLPFWTLAFIVTLLEVWMGLFLILSWGFGIDFRNAHFYNHWAKHYRYRAATSNRQITVELSCYVFVISKLLILNDYFCYNADRRAARLEEPHTPTRGGLPGSDDDDNDGDGNWPEWWDSDGPCACFDTMLTVSVLCRCAAYLLLWRWPHLEWWPAIFWILAFPQFILVFFVLKCLDEDIVLLLGFYFVFSAAIRGELGIHAWWMFALLIMKLSITDLGPLIADITAYNDLLQDSWMHLKLAVQTWPHRTPFLFVTFVFVILSPFKPLYTCLALLYICTVTFFWVSFFAATLRSEARSVPEPTRDSALRQADVMAVVKKYITGKYGKNVLIAFLTKLESDAKTTEGLEIFYEFLQRSQGNLDHSEALELGRRAVQDSSTSCDPDDYPVYHPDDNFLSFDAPFVRALLEQDTVANLRYGVLFLLALSSLGVYSIILAGWSSNSKYAFIGALRSAAQMISYEVAISLIILPVVVFCGSLNLTMITYVQSITQWLLWPLFPVALLFLIAMLAETNRTPFDLPEAEAELVAGYNVDYSSLPFAMFFLGEYCNMILISTLYCLLFLSGGLNSFGLSSAFVLAAKASVIWVFFVLVRATLPRYRYDQLMDIGWKVFLPVSGSFLLFVFGVLVFFDALPVTNELPASIAVLNDFA